VSGTYLGALPLRDAKLSEVLSGASDGSGVLPLDDRAVRRQDPFRATIPRRSCCWAERIVLDEADRVVSSSYPWAGIVLGRERSRSGRSLALSMVTWPGYFQRRLVLDQTHIQRDKFAIFRDLVTDACLYPHWLNEQYPAPLPDPVPLLSTAYEPLNLSGVLADRTYLAADLRTVLEELRSLAASGDGFDWRMYPWRRETGLFAVGLDLGYPRLGRVAPPDLVWSDDEDDPAAGDLLDYTISENGAGVDNYLVALGEGQGPTQLRSTVTAAYVGRDEFAYGYPLWESSVRGGTQQIRTQETLDEQTRGAMLAGLLSETTLTGVRVRGDLTPTLDRWSVGDDGTFRIGSTTTGEPTTIVGQIVARTIEPPEQGRPERVTLDVQGTAA
jgi:hypothetical protein